MSESTKFIEMFRNAKWHTLIRCISAQPFSLYVVFLAVLRQLRPELRMLARLTPNGAGYPMFCFEPGERGLKVVFAALGPQLVLGPSELPQAEVDALDASSRAEACRTDAMQALMAMRPIVARLKNGDFTRGDLDKLVKTPQQRARTLRMADAACGPLVTLVIGGRCTRFGGEEGLPVALTDPECLWREDCRIVSIERNANWIVEADDPSLSVASGRIAAQAMNEVVSERLRLAWAVKTRVRLYARVAEDVGSGRLSLLVEDVDFTDGVDGIGRAFNQALLRAQLPLFRMETSAERSTELEFGADETQFAASVARSVPIPTRRPEASAVSTRSS